MCTTNQHSGYYADQYKQCYAANPKRASTMNRLSLLSWERCVGLAIFFCSVGIILAVTNEGEEVDYIIVTDSSGTRRVPVTDSLVDGFNSLTRPGGILSEDPVARRFSESLKAKQHSDEPPDFRFYLILISFSISIVLVIQAIRIRSRNEDL